MKKAVITLIFIFNLVLIAFSQGEASDSSITIHKDTIPLKSKFDFRNTGNHSPGKAALFSLALPGLGQAYNRKYWKIPIVYGLLGTTVFFTVKNFRDWKTHSNAYRYRIDGDSTTIDEFDGKLSTSNLLSLKKYYKRNLDLSIIFTFVVYAINIVDAAVDGHFFKFDVSDDLSLYLDPVINYSANKQNQFYGFSLNLKL